jgi:mRNA-degrading endonuclease RelE of RelBE toxin-antitoxin system
LASGAAPECWKSASGRNIFVERLVAFSDNERMQIDVPRAVVRQIYRMPRGDRDALLAKLDSFAADPFAPHPWAAPLVGRPDAVRVRHGQWRALCRIDRIAATVIVELVAHRREVYR